MKPLCSVPGCGDRATSRGMCGMHYQRWRRNGDPLVRRGIGNGEALRFFQDVVLAYDGDDCLIWPFATDGHGYGKLWKDGALRVVSRLVCEDEHGPALFSDYVAAHSCGRGHEACVARSHLSWKSPAENMADKLVHGTHMRGERNHTTQIARDAVREIKNLFGKLPPKQIAKQFGVTVDVVYQIRSGRSWAWLSSGDAT